MDEIIRFNNILYRFVGILTHMETPYYVVERIDEAVYNFLYITRNENNGEKTLEYAPPEVVADLVDQLFRLCEG